MSQTEYCLIYSLWLFFVNDTSLHPRLQFRSPSCLLVVSPCLETLSKLCWVFSSFRHPPLCKSSLASSSGPRWGRHCRLPQASCYFVWNNRDYDPFTTILHAIILFDSLDLLFLFFGLFFHLCEAVPILTCLLLAHDQNHICFNLLTKKKKRETWRFCNVVPQR